MSEGHVFYFSSILFLSFSCSYSHCFTNPIPVYMSERPLVMVNCQHYHSHHDLRVSQYHTSSCQYHVLISTLCMIRNQGHGSGAVGQVNAGKGLMMDSITRVFNPLSDLTMSRRSEGICEG